MERRALRSHEGVRVRELRHGAGETMKQLAQSLGNGVTLHTIYRLETGRTPPGLALLRMVADHYGVALSEIVGGE